jgi:mono/diheme cytochrome c family protein
MKTRTWALAVLLGWVLAVVVILGAPARIAVAAADGAALYKTKCASCHGADGKGNTAYGKTNKLRDLGSAEVQAQSDQQLYDVTAKGKGKMPGYEKSLGAEGVKALVAFMRTLKH